MFSRARADNKGSDSIESTCGNQNGSGGVQRDSVLVNEEEYPFSPDRDVLRKTEIPGMGIRSSPRKKHGNDEIERVPGETEAGTGCRRANP